MQERGNNERSTNGGPEVLKTPGDASQAVGRARDEVRPSHVLSEEYAIQLDEELQRAFDMGRTDVVGRRIG